MKSEKTSMMIDPLLRSAVSQKQQRFMAICEHRPEHARGKCPSMSREELHKFSSTKRKGLPVSKSEGRPVRCSVCGLGAGKGGSKQHRKAARHHIKMAGSAGQTRDFKTELLNAADWHDRQAQGIAGWTGFGRHRTMGKSQKRKKRDRGSEQETRYDEQKMRRISEGAIPGMYTYPTKQYPKGRYQVLLGKRWKNVSGGEYRSITRSIDPVLSGALSKARRNKAEPSLTYVHCSACGGSAPLGQFVPTGGLTATQRARAFSAGHRHANAGHEPMITTSSRKPRSMGKSVRRSRNRVHPAGLPTEVVREKPKAKFRDKAHAVSAAAAVGKIKDPKARREAARQFMSDLFGVQFKSDRALDAELRKAARS